MEKECANCVGTGSILVPIGLMPPLNRHMTIDCPICDATGVVEMQDFERLEVEYGKWAGVENCVACSSGTAALVLAFEALGLPKGSVILMSDFNMIACARAAVMAGLEPEFVDCDDRLLIDVEKLEKQIRYYGTWIDGKCTHNRVSAILATHIYGRVCYTRIGEIAKKYKVKLIEDCAEAHGAGRFNPVDFEFDDPTDAQCLSFYANKIVNGAEGGLVSFLQKEHAEKAKSLRSLGFTPDHDFMHIPRGHNYRMSNAHAKIILDRETNRWGSLGDADDNLKRRKQVEDWYNEFIPEKWHMPVRDVVWVYDLRIPKLEWDRMGIVVKGLNERGIAARHGFKPMSMQPEFRTDGVSGTIFLPAEAFTNQKAYKASREVFYLPVRPDMTRAGVSTVASMTIDALRDVGIG